MRYRVGITGLLAMGMLLSEASPAQAPQADIESSEPAAGDETNIFDTLQIELLDLERLREELEDTLTGEPLRLTLTECVHKALRHNQDILVVGFETAIADSGILGARGEFDPTLTLRNQVSSSSVPPNPSISAFSGITSNIITRLVDYQLQIGGKTPIGTQYGVDLSVQRERGTFTTPPMSRTLSIYSADMTFTLTQPILRGFGLDTNLVRVRTAKNNRSISDAQVALILLNSLGEVVKAYWNLVGAVEQTRVQQESLDNALRVLHINEQRYELGTAAALEVLQAKAGVAVRQSDLVTARTATLDAEDVLKNLIGLYDDAGELLSSANIIPVERPNIESVEWDIRESMRTALALRPDIRSAQLAVDNAKLDASRARDDLLPALDVTGTYGRSTIQQGGTGLFGGLADRDGYSWTVAVEGSVPIGNRAARGGYTRAKLIKRQQEQRLIKSRQDVMLNVRLAVHSLASNRILVESTKQARVLEQANVVAEEKRLRIGVTTAQKVLDKQEDLTAAQVREVRATVDFERSLIDLQVSEGTLLQNLGIVYESPEYDEGIGFFRSLGPNPNGRHSRKNDSS